MDVKLNNLIYSVEAHQLKYRTENNDETFNIPKYLTQVTTESLAYTKQGFIVSNYNPNEIGNIKNKFDSLLRTFRLQEIIEPMTKYNTHKYNIEKPYILVNSGYTQITVLNFEEKHSLFQNTLIHFVDRLGKNYGLNLPNIWESNKICMGNDVNISKENVHEYSKQLLDLFYNLKFNTDLDYLKTSHTGTTEKFINKLNQEQKDALVNKRFLELEPYIQSDEDKSRIQQGLHNMLDSDFSSCFFSGCNSMGNYFFCVVFDLDFSNLY